MWFLRPKLVALLFSPFFFRAFYSKQHVEKGFDRHHTPRSPPLFSSFLDYFESLVSSLSARSFFFFLCVVPYPAYGFTAFCPFGSEIK